MASDHVSSTVHTKEVSAMSLDITTTHTKAKECIETEPDHETTVAPSAKGKSSTTSRLEDDLANIPPLDTPAASTNLSDMPYDIAVQIFELAGLSGATCIGLTCKQLYTFLKTKHPRRIALGYQNIGCLHSWRHLESGEHHSTHCQDMYPNLGVLLQDWMRPKYRLFEAEERHWFGRCWLRWPLDVN